MENKPRYLYRGIKIKYEQLKHFKFYGVDIELPYEPYIDSLGRKTVYDGNEYGIYMSDNKTLIQNVYSGCEIMDGSLLAEYTSLGIKTLRIPAIGIAYKIDTNGLDVHKPWITDYLKGHYNNTYQGHEWIAEKIPARNYTIIEIIIGPDLLHDTEIIKVTNLLAAEQKVKEIIEKRKKRLELLAKELEKIPINMRQQYLDKYRKLFIDLFGENGVRYCNINNLPLNSGLDYIQYLLAFIYKQNKESIDYNTLEYIELLKSKLKASSSITDLEKLIQSDILSNIESKKRFIESKKNSNNEINTTYYDRLNELYTRILKIIQDKKDSMSFITPIEPSETDFLRELEVTYQRYLEGRKQPITEDPKLTIFPERIEYLRKISIEYGINFDELFYAISENSEIIKPENISNIERPRRPRH